MKLLILSDLHIPVEYVVNQFKLEIYKKKLQNQIKSNYDIVLISGDVFEHQVTKHKNVYEILNYLFDGKKVVFCLGNHEFAYEDYNSVITTYDVQYKIFKEKYYDKDIICLDVCGQYNFNNYRIVGNVFWYDWSLNNCRTLMKGEIIEGWLDNTIENFDPLQEHNFCKQQIFNNIDKSKNMILLTHTVPHEFLNTFSKEQPTSPFNSYSGTKDFLKELNGLNFKYAICGHTHRREINEIYGIKCINIGNDYFFRTNKIEYFILDI